jgi:hypothetical protein
MSVEVENMSGWVSDVNVNLWLRAFDQLSLNAATGTLELYLMKR